MLLGLGDARCRLHERARRRGVLMAELEELQKRISILEDVEAIKKLKSRYWRCLDRKLWDELADCFVEDAKFDIAPAIKLQGRKEFVEFLVKMLGSARTAHQGHNAEIEITSDTTARGTWALYDDIRFIQPNSRVRGYGFYEEEYVKDDGSWKIGSMKLGRTFLERSKWES